MSLWLTQIFLKVSGNLLLGRTCIQIFTWRCQKGNNYKVQFVCSLHVSEHHKNGGGKFYMVHAEWLIGCPLGSRRRRRKSSLASGLNLFWRACQLFLVTLGTPHRLKRPTFAWIPTKSKLCKFMFRNIMFSLSVNLTTFAYYFMIFRNYRQKN